MKFGKGNITTENYFLALRIFGAPVSGPGIIEFSAISFRRSDPYPSIKEGIISQLTHKQM